MKVGYARISTADQSIERQEIILKELHTEQNFIDVCSGKNQDRPQLKEMLNFVRKGDELIVESISRLARNTKDLLEIIENLRQKNVKFVSQKEFIDTDTVTGRFVLTIFGAVAELERENMLERQREGIAIAKTQGKYKGRPPKNINKTEFESTFKIWKNGEMKTVEFARKFNLTPRTIYRKIKEYEIKNNLR